MNLATAAQWIEQRGTWATSVETLVRDLGVSREEAHTAIHHLQARGIIVRVRSPVRASNQYRRSPDAFALYVHHSAAPKVEK